MERTQITEFLSELLERKLYRETGTQFAKEVCLDVGTSHPVRVDYMSFHPAHQLSVSGIEKGIFTCYEVKSCKADFKSGFGQNYLGEKNYLVMTMGLYKEIQQEIPRGVGVMVAIPYNSDSTSEYFEPTELTEKNIKNSWILKIVVNSYAISGNRKKSMIELLYAMLRAKR